MSPDPTGYAGPHPDLRDQICETANVLAEDSRDLYNWPSRAFVPDDFMILGQRTWERAPSIYPAIDGGSFSMALVEAHVDGRRYGGMVEAVLNPGQEAWGLLGASLGERNDGRPAAGDSGGAGRRYIGLHVSPDRSSKAVKAIEIEYADGTIHRAERQADDCVMLFSPAPNWDLAEAEISVRYLDSNGAIIESYSRVFNPGPRPPELA
jgi:hypothetical protein